MLFFLFIYAYSLSTFSSIQFYLNSQFFIYFIVSEVFFFFGVFWSLFWIFFSYNLFLVSNFPVIYPFGLALFNTFLLLLSSVFAICYHINFLNSLFSYDLFICFFLGFFFIFNQYMEFTFSYFTISDFSLGSIFFFSTGFHGFHVFVGLVFILISIISVYIYLFNFIFFLNSSLLYWHFVDVIWLFLFTFLYIFIFFLY